MSHTATPKPVEMLNKTNPNKIYIHIKNYNVRNCILGQRAHLLCVGITHLDTISLASE